MIRMNPAHDTKNPPGSYPPAAAADTVTVDRELFHRLLMRAEFWADEHRRNEVLERDPAAAQEVLDKARKV